MQIQAHGRGIAFHCGGVNLQCGHIFVPALRANVFHRCATPGDQIIHSTGETACGFVERTEMLDHCDLRHFIRNEQQMRKDGGVFVNQPMKNFNRRIEFHRARNVNKGARADLSTMQGRVFGGTKCCGLGHKIFTHEVLVLDQRAFQRLENHPGLAQ